jgi:UDPglucose 6-dehydrogenase
MKITMIGAGYVGLVSGTCFSEFGHDVICVDVNPAVVDKLRADQVPFFEPGLEDMVARNRKAGRLRFSDDLGSSVAGVDAVFIAVGTPTRRGDGHADLTYVMQAAEQVVKAATGPLVLVTKSTVPVGTAKKLQTLVAQLAPAHPISVASNPEFLREGAAIEDFMRPDRVVCGVEDARAETVLKDIYRPLSLRETPVMITNCETSELIKYAANAFLATKISFINEVADLCEKVGANVQQVAKGIGMDARIGAKFLHPGPGYGGSCFPKDTLAFLRIAEDAEVPARIVAATVEVNDQRKRAMARRVINACGGSVAGKTIGVLGLTFKPNTDDMRDSPSLTILPTLQAEGARIQAHDPEGEAQARKLMPDLDYKSDPYDAIDGADALLILTEWNEYRALDLPRVLGMLKSPTFIDLRNIYRPEQMAEAGFDYHSIGRPTR